MARRDCRVCAEKDRIIEVLAEQIEYLRLLLGTPNLKPVAGVARDEPRLVPMTVPAHMSEDEEDIRALIAGGHLPTHVAEEALAQLGAANTKVEIDHFNDAA